MTRLRLFIVLALAACAFASVAAASANAHEFTVQLLSAFHFKLFDILELGTTNKLTGTPFGVSTKIQCEHRHWLLIEILLKVQTKARLEFENCTVEKPANCTVIEPIVSEVVGTLEESGGGLVNKFAPAAGTTFAEITLEGASCSIKGKPFKVEGTQTCELPEATVDLKVHTIACKTAGSALKAGGKEATFESSAASLEVESGEFTEGGETFGAGVEWGAI